MKQFRFAFFFFFIPFQAIIASPSPFLSAPAASPVIEVTQADYSGQAALTLRTRETGAEVYMDFRYRGTSPVTLEGLAAGTHTITVRKTGYYDQILTVSLAADTRTSMYLELQLIMGWLDIRVLAGGSFASQAKIGIDGREYPQGILELPVGPHAVVARAFGYAQRSLDVIIIEKSVTRTELDLEPEPFRAYDFSTSPSTFNPMNSGRAGVMEISFSVTNRGTARIAIVDGSEAEVDSITMSAFDTWSQAASWDGIDDAGKPFPDGEYGIRVSLSADPDPAVPREKDSYEFSSSVTVDSSQVVTPRPFFGPGAGPGFVPQAFPYGADAVRTGICALIDFSQGVPEDAVTTLFMGLTLAKAFEGYVSVELGLMNDSVAFALSLSYEAKLAGFFALGITADGRLAGVGTAPGDSSDRPSNVRVRLPLSLGSRFLHADLAPGFSASFGETTEARLTAGAGLTMESYFNSTSLSFEASSASLDQGFAIGLPLRFALETAFMPRGISLTLSGLLGIDAGNGPMSFRAGCGLSLEL